LLRRGRGQLHRRQSERAEFGGRRLDVGPPSSKGILAGQVDELAEPEGLRERKIFAPGGGPLPVKKTFLKKGRSFSRGEKKTGGRGDSNFLIRKKKKESGSPHLE